MAERLQTVRDRERIYEAVVDWWDEHNESPTRGRLAHDLGLTYNFVQHHVQVLIAQGRLRADGHRRFRVY